MYWCAVYRYVGVSKIWVSELCVSMSGVLTISVYQVVFIYVFQVFVFIKSSSHLRVSKEGESERYLMKSSSQVFYYVCSVQECLNDALIASSDAIM